MERKSMADRRAERLAQRAQQETETAEWIAKHPRLVAAGINSIHEDAPAKSITLVEHTDMLEPEAAADRAAQAEVEATGATYRGEA